MAALIINIHELMTITKASDKRSLFRLR